MLELVGGTSPAPGTAAPNALFMAHSLAIADLYVALPRSAGVHGLRLIGWLRDEESWEEWSGVSRRGSLCPDALRRRIQ